MLEVLFALCFPCQGTFSLLNDEFLTCVCLLLVICTADSWGNLWGSVLVPLSLQMLLCFLAMLQLKKASLPT